MHLKFVRSFSNTLPPPILSPPTPGLENIYPAYVSIPNSKRKKTYSVGDSKQRRMALSCSKKTISIIDRNKFENINGDFYCLSCLDSFRIRPLRTLELESYENVFENKDICHIVMPSKDSKIFEFNKYQKSDKAAFIIYAVLESSIEKIDGCINNPENSFTTKVGEHILPSFSGSTILSFKSIENKHEL